MFTNGPKRAQIPGNGPQAKTAAGRLTARLIGARRVKALALVLAGLLGAMGGVAPSTAQAEGPVVVELFTSQGCASCPPADALLAELSTRPDIIALALHVDYWDYIGWADTFADPAFTERQHGYARAQGSNMVYTPHMVINGRTHMGGYRPMDVAESIAEHRALARPVALELHENDGRWQLSVAWVGQGPAPAMVVDLVQVQPLDEVEITRGENAGLTVRYVNIVRDWSRLGDWTGGAPQIFDLGAEVAEMERVVIVQAAGMGGILAAARVAR